MHRKLCLMHANCQGDELETLLTASTAFNRTYRLTRRTNYTREPLNPRELADCDLFLYQHLGEPWGDLSSAALLRQLPATALAVRIPNLMFKGYWPFWTSNSPIAFGDSLLNRLIDEGAPKPVILRIYLHGNIQTFVNLKASLEETIAIERHKEQQSPVKTVDFLLSRWKRRLMFHTINHPGREMLVHTADGILEAAGLPPLGQGELAAAFARGLPSYTDFDLPIHPQVAAFHGLNFAGPEQRYAVFGRTMTFEAYISRYIDCRLNGMGDNFIGYLQLV